MSELEDIAADALVYRKVRVTARESLLIIQLDVDTLDLTLEDQVSAARALGEMNSTRALSVLQKKFVVVICCPIPCGFTTEFCLILIYLVNEIF